MLLFKPIVFIYGYVPLVVNTSRSFPRSWLITGFVVRLTRRVSLVEQELLTLPEHLSSPSVLSGVRVTRSLDLYVCFVDRCVSFCTFSFGHCVDCFSSIYGFWLPLWYLQTLLIICELLEHLLFQMLIHPQIRYWYCIFITYIVMYVLFGWYSYQQI